MLAHGMPVAPRAANSVGWMAARARWSTQMGAAAQTAEGSRGTPHRPGSKMYSNILLKPTLRRSVMGRKRRYGCRLRRFTPGKPPVMNRGQLAAVRAQRATKRGFAFQKSTKR